LLFLPRGTEMFQFPRCPPPALCVQAGVTGHDPSRVSPFRYPRIEAWSAAPRGFSQPPTSFIGIWRQGIHRWLFVAWEYLHFLRIAKSVRCSCSLCSSQRTVGVLGAGRTRPSRTRGPLRATTKSHAPSKRNSDGPIRRGPVVPPARPPMELEVETGRVGRVRVTE
jgi:hypothetical protein